MISNIFSVLFVRVFELFDKVEEFFTGKFVAMYGLAITRILLGLTGIGLLLTNFSSRHYSFGVGAAWNREFADPYSDFTDMFLFSMFNEAKVNPVLFTWMMVGLGVLAFVVMIGWKTRFVLPVYFVAWVSFIELMSVIGDEGDNAYRIFMIALMFADTTRRLSVDAWLRKRKFGEVLGAGDGHWLWKLLNNVAVVFIIVQVCFIYMAGGLYKAGGDAWQHGYAVYNVLQTELFGVLPWLNDLLTVWGPMAVAFAWGSILFQCAFPFLLLKRWTRVIGLLGILSFHVGIGVLMGIPWFSLTMIAADAVFISDKSFERLGAFLREKVFVNFVK